MDTKKPKRIKGKKKQGLGKLLEDNELDIDLENLQPWIPDTSVWSSDSENEHLPSDDDVEESSSEPDSELEDQEVERAKLAMNGSYTYSYGDLSGDEAEETQDWKYFVRDLNVNAFRVQPHQIASPQGREAMRQQVMKESHRIKAQFVSPSGSYLRCPEGGDHLPATFRRRQIHGPFLYCPVSHLQCALFHGYAVKSKRKAGLELPTFRRPPSLKIRKLRYPPYGRVRSLPVELDCKHCSMYAFTHHRDPDMHYEDYVNLVKFKGCNPESKSAEEAFNEMQKKWEKLGNRKKRRTVKNTEAKPLPPPPFRPRVGPAYFPGSKLFADTVATLNKKKSMAVGDHPDESPTGRYSLKIPVEPLRKLPAQEKKGENPPTKVGVPQTTVLKTIPPSSSCTSSACHHSNLSIRPAKATSTLYNGTIASERRKHLTLRKKRTS